MESSDRKKHWENIYQTKEFKDVSWFESTPDTSLNFFQEYKVPLSAKIIDVGGGDSFLVDHLLDLGYEDISVLDISEAAIERAKLRLGERAGKMKWIIADAANFEPKEKYDFWHDRAAFHFLTEEEDIKSYTRTVQQNLNLNGIMVIGTFSKQGPEKCSGIKIKQYSETTMTDLFKPFLEKIKCVTTNHKTPSGTLQNFVFCSFKKFQSS